MMLIGTLLVTGRAAADLPQTIERIKPGVVAIGTFLKTRNPSFAFLGTGFAVGDGSLITTNAHVVPGVANMTAGESLVAIGSSGKTPLEVQLVRLDPHHDLALLRLKTGTLPALVLGDSVSLREGQSLAFTGYPIGSVLGLHAATHRALVAAVTPIAGPSRTSRQLDVRAIKRLREEPYTILQLDATAYPGNSGSPLYDPETGAVVGVINMVFVKGAKEAALTHPSGIAYAIPVIHIADLLRAVSDGK